jgi:uncharacterized protein YdhG (YjbR/CyaY superfamily)
VTGHPFAAYLSNQPEPQRRTLETMAASLRRILPDAQEAMSYSMPAFVCDGTAIAGLAGFKNHCSYFPHSGAVLGQLAGELAGYDFDDGTLRMPIDQPLPAALLRKLVLVKLRVENQHAPRAGKVREFYDNGVVKSRGSIRDGAMHGAWTFYRKDGSVMRTGSFRLGERTGVWRTFDRAGGMVRESSF